jgi:hypothetical protein
MELGEIPELLLVDAKLFSGLESLYTRPSRHALGEIEPLDDDLSDEQIDRSRRQLASTLRDSLTVTRANRFAIAAFDEHGPRVASNQLLRTDDDLADLIACLLHGGSRDACFEICIPRDANDPASDRRTHDPVLAGTRRLERFTLLKK